MNRVLALDMGERRVGIAVSDPLGLTAQPLETYVRKGSERDIEYFANLAREWQAERFVLGLPLHMNGDFGDKAELVTAFSEKLREATGLEVSLVDERLTTVAAHRILSEGNARHNKRKQVVDTVAAVLILETWLGQNRH